jgi:hypothetical protein
MLSSSVIQGRQVVIQSMLRMAMTFYLSARPSTLGTAHQKYKDLGHVYLRFMLYCLID